MPGILCAVLTLHGYTNPPVRDSSPQTGPQIQSSKTTIEPPFDKLELFAFLAAGPIDSYASQVLRERGASFTPDAEFIAAFPWPGFQALLKSVSARNATVAPSKERDEAYALLRRAWTTKQNRRFTDANETYQEVLKLVVDSPSVHLAYGSNLLLQQNYSAAEGEIRHSIRLWPDDALAHAELAMVLVAQKRFEDGEKAAREALRIFPEERQAKFALAVALAHERKWSDAIPALRTAITILPNLADLKKLLGISLVETGKTAEGKEELNLFLKSTPGDAEGHYYLGVALRQEGNGKDAQAQFAEALRLHPENAQYGAAAEPTGGAVGGAPSTRNFDDGAYISEHTYTNQFLGFTYEFPSGWTVLSLGTARAITEAGSQRLLSGDPTDQDVKKAAGTQCQSLLLVAESREGIPAASIRTVMVSACDAKFTAGMTPETYANGVAQLLRDRHVIEGNDPVEKRSFGGHEFWKLTMLMSTPAGPRYGTEFISEEKDYMLLFVASGPDKTGVEELAKTLESVRFMKRSE